MFRNLPWKMMIKPFSSNRAGHRQKSVAFYLQVNVVVFFWCFQIPISAILETDLFFSVMEEVLHGVAK